MKINENHHRISKNELLPDVVIFMLFASLREIIKITWHNENTVSQSSGESNQSICARWTCIYVYIHKNIILRPAEDFHCRRDLFMNIVVVWYYGPRKPSAGLKKHSDCKQNCVGGRLWNISYPLNPNLTIQLAVTQIMFIRREPPILPPDAGRHIWQSGIRGGGILGFGDDTRQKRVHASTMTHIFHYNSFRHRRKVFGWAEISQVMTSVFWLK